MRCNEQDATKDKTLRDGTNKTIGWHNEARRRNETSKLLTGLYFADERAFGSRQQDKPDKPLRRLCFRTCSSSAGASCPLPFSALPLPLPLLPCFTAIHHVRESAGGIAVVIFFLLVSVVGLLKDMQIAFFAVAKISADERGDSSWAKRTCALLFRGNVSICIITIGNQLYILSSCFSLPPKQ